MSDFKTPTNEELHTYLNEIPDLLDGSGPLINNRSPDGTRYDWDEDLKVAVETAPEGKQYIVNYQKGHGLLRVKELMRGTA